MVYKALLCWWPQLVRPILQLNEISHIVKLNMDLLLFLFQKNDVHNLIYQSDGGEYTWNSQTAQDKYLYGIWIRFL